MNEIKIVIEAGKKRVFASALNWPGWSRSGRDEAQALQALLDYGTRYARVMRAGGIGFEAPEEVSGLVVAARQEGDATTDFGAPGAILESEYGPPGQEELARLGAILAACWAAFDAAVQQAQGKTLRLGPRGGGRGREKIVAHVLGGEQAYLSSLAWKMQKSAQKDLFEQLRHTRQEMQHALDAAARGALPERRPRGGRPWPVRYFIRRAAWHVLDHAWEIEDRVQ